MQQGIIGWDIGGAHVKAALLDRQGSVVDVALYPCPLWKGMKYLQDAIQAVLSQFPQVAYRHAVTMTGELVDLFDSREHGVKRILATMQDNLAGYDMLIYAGQRGFLAPAQLSPQDCLDIASMNWLASASLTAQKVGSGLFVDMGSTTTDILIFADGKVDALGLTDYQRLISAELIYTGIVRTAVMAVAQRAIFNGRNMELMAEYFATMADVYRLTGDLVDVHDLGDTADGGPKTTEASARRLSRMTGYEFAAEDWPLWLDFAKNLKSIQKQRIASACQKQLSRLETSAPACFVGAGIGRFMIREIAEAAGHSYLDFNDLIAHGECESLFDSADCAPAVAVAGLALGVC